MEKEAREVEELFDRAAQIWTILEEDEKVQQWDQEEETINTSIQELKKRQKTMSITECLKGTQDMKKLQTELKTTQTKKQERQDELEPLQEQATQMIVQLEEEKKSMAHAQTEGHNIDAGGDNSAVSGGANRKSCADQGKRKGTSRKVPQFGHNSTRSVHYLSGSG
jgi:hypothetical protein